MNLVDYAIVGGGIVGLAIGAVLSRFGSTILIERHGSLISETSSRNSGVVHAGIYYPSNSLKTKLCIEGNANIWRLLERQPTAIAARRIGKWIGSCEEDEETALQQLIENMKAREIAYEMVPTARRVKLEPHVAMTAVVNSLHTGIIDVETLKNFFLASMETAQTESAVVLKTDVKSIYIPSTSGRGDLAENVIRLVTRHVRDTSESFDLHIRRALVCAAGLGAPELWQRICSDYVPRPWTCPPHHTLYFCKGRYAAYRGKPPVSRLVYPCPLPQLVGLGVHSVVDMGGSVRFGPDAVYVDSPTDYQIGLTETETEAFLDLQFNAIKRYIRNVERERLCADFVGIRPKLSGKGMPFRDFLIEEVDATGSTLPLQEDTEQGRARLIMLNGIESPGLTACTAIADLVAKSLIGSKRFKSNPSPWTL